LQALLSGHESRELMNAQGPVSIAARAMVAAYGTGFSTYGPTPNHNRNLEIAESLFAGLEQRLNNLMQEDVPALRTALDEAGVPWTPGRGIPGGD